MLEELKYKGYWKLPNSEKWQLNGELNFSIKNKIRLEAIGSFSGNDYEGKFEYPIIHGFSTEGKKITLVNCRGWYSSAMPGLKTSKIEAEFIIIGEYFDNIDEINFQTFAVHYLYLDEWVNIHGFNTGKIESFNEKKYNTSLNYTQPDLIELYKGDDKDILIWFSVVAPFIGLDVKENSISQKTFINFKYHSSISLKKGFDDINHFRNFFAFGLSRAIIPTEIIGYLKTASPSQSDKVNIIFNQEYYPRILSDNIFDYTTLFSYCHIEAKTKEIVNNWLTKYDGLRPVFDRYFDCIYNPNLYPINRFLNLVFAIETYHRRISDESYFSSEKFTGLKGILRSALPPTKENFEWFDARFNYANELSLRTRLRLLCLRFKDIIEEFEPNIKIFIDKVLSTRNYYVHYDETLKNKIIKENQFFEYNSSLEIILQLCLLNELGFTQEEMKKAIKRSQINWHKFHK